MSRSQDVRRGSASQTAPTQTESAAAPRLEAKAAQTEPADVETLRRRLAHQQSHDPLTDLPNRAYFNELLDGALQREPIEVAVLVIDLDNFQLRNDVAGQTSGDMLLQAFADRLRRSIRRTDVAARLGGDEFAVLLDGVIDAEEAAAAARHIHQDLRQPIEIDGELTSQGCSIGLALALKNESVNDVMRRADVALYAAKRDGKDTVANFDHELFRAMQQQHSLVRDLERAIGTEEVQVAYQPIVDLHTGEIHSVETLARWTDRNGQPVSPELFVRTAEQHGLIAPLFEQMFHRSLADAKPWIDQHPDLQLHTNLSPLQMRQEGLADTIGDALDRAGIATRNVAIEITESVLATDQEIARHNLHALADMGIAICLDDFGTGYSSLAYLIRFTPSMLKLDRSFVDEMTRTGDNRLPRLILFLARELQIEAVAEGVETVEQWETLRDLGWGLGQGFLMSRGVSAGDFGDLLGTSLLPIRS